MQTTLNRNDYTNFLIQAYFGRHCFDEPLMSCVDRAYLDFNRTLHGLKNLPRAEDLHRQVRGWLATKICSAQGETTQSAFDDWHHSVCASLIDHFDVHSRDISFQFHAGQAQKWINMTFKYIFTLGETLLGGFSAIYEFCHAPIDRIVIERLKPCGFPKISKPWSKLNYDEYFDCQKWLRDKFDMPPLDVEFRAWQNSGAKFKF